MLYLFSGGISGLPISNCNIWKVAWTTDWQKLPIIPADTLEQWEVSILLRLRVPFSLLCVLLCGGRLTEHLGPHNRSGARHIAVLDVMRRATKAKCGRYS